jgi:hypothetical protein
MAGCTSAADPIEKNVLLVDNRSEKIASEVKS